MKRTLLFLASFLLAMATSSYAGNTKSFWTEVPSSNLTTAINVVSYESSTITVTAAFYDAHGTVLGNATQALAPDARWNFATNNTGNSTLAALLQSNVTGSVWVKSGTSTQNFGAYSTVYKTTSISGFNFTLSSGIASVDGSVGTTYTLNPSATGTDSTISSDTGGTSTTTDTSTTSGDTVVIFGSLAASTSKAGGISGSRYAALGGAEVKIITAAGVVIGTATADSNGIFSIEVPAGSNYIVRGKKGNVCLKKFIRSATANTSVTVDPASSAEVKVIGKKLGHDNFGEEDDDASEEMELIDVDELIEAITESSLLSQITAAIVNDISSNGDYTSTSSTVSVGVVSTAGDDVATSIAVNITVTVNITTSEDTTAPSGGGVTINSGDTSTTNSAVTLTLSAIDSVGVIAYYASETSTTPSASASGWTLFSSTTSYSGTGTFTLSSELGDKTVYVWYRDGAGNVSESLSDSITLNSDDTTAPSNVSLTISDVTTTSSSITTTVSCEDSTGVTAYYISETATTPSSDSAGWVSVTSTTSYSVDASLSLSSGYGTKTVYGWCKDSMGNVSSSASGSVIYLNEWVNLYGNSAFDRGHDIAIDSSRNVYITGQTSGNLDGETNNGGGSDGFISKYDSSGTLQWTRLIGTSASSYEASNSVAIDSSGNVYISGKTYGDLDGNDLDGSDPGGSEVRTVDVFVAKYDASGNKQWTTLLSETYPAYGGGGYLAVDSSGNTYVTGHVWTDTNAQDTFIAKFDTNGDKLWSDQSGLLSGDSGGDFGLAIIVDSSGNAYIAGDTNQDKILFMKYDTDGNQQWVQYIGSGSAQAITMDSNNNLYIAGYTSSNLDGEINAGGDADAFVVKYDSSGTRVWTTLIGASTTQIGTGVAMDSNGNVYVGGYTRGTLHGNAYIGGTYDLFMTKLDTSGNRIWTELLGSASEEVAFGVAVDSSGNAYMTGRTEGDIKDNTNQGGYGDIFLWKLGENDF